MADKDPEILIVTGAVNSGKSTAMTELAASEKSKGALVSGIIARGVIENGAKVGFDVVDVVSGKCQPLARIGKPGDNCFTVGKYCFFDDGFNFARGALMSHHKNGVAFLDEAGPIELAGNGYAECLRTLLKSDISKIYISVQDSCLDDIIREFCLRKPDKIITVDRNGGSL